MPSLRDLVENFGVSQPFGVEGPFGGAHTGVDLPTPTGTPIPALGEGTIANVFYDPIGGHQVKVKYASGAEGWFAHLQDVYAQIGERVSANTIIGASGDSGHVTGAHLHFEERDPSGQLVDPLNEQSQTYIGRGGADVPGSSWSPTADALKPLDDAIRGILPKTNPLDPIGGAVGKLGDDLARGTKQLAVAAVIVSVVVVLGYSGLRKALD